MREPERIRHDPHSEPAGRELALGLTYPDAIRRAGAVPVVIPPLDEAAIEPLLDGLWGLCLSGGPDLQPSAYGADPHPELGPTEPHLDVFEIALVRAAEAREMPVLAICRGMQVLNVAHGGTLYQHLPDEPGTDLPHRKANLGDPVVMHEVLVEPDSLLALSMGTERVVVNSYHHQAPRRVGEGLRRVAWTEDGIVEGLEVPDAEFLLGVQWHPEADETSRLIGALVEHAAARVR